MSNRGTFYVFEGIDGVGKTSATALFAEHLRATTGSNPLVMAFPKRETAIGILLGQHLRGERIFHPLVAHQLFAANRLESAWLIHKALKSGRDVVADRYAFSGAAYTMAQSEEVDSQWCLMHDVKSAAPAHVFWLQLSPADAMQRIADSKRADDNEIYEEESFLKRVAREFGRVFDDYETRSSCCAIEDWMASTSVHKIDAGQARDEVLAQIVAATENL